MLLQVPCETFARCAAKSKHPELWEGLVGDPYAPFLGRQPVFPSVHGMTDASGHGHHGILVNIDPRKDRPPR